MSGVKVTVYKGVSTQQAAERAEVAAAKAENASELLEDFASSVEEVKEQILATGVGLPEEFPAPGSTITATTANQWTMLEPGTYHQASGPDIIVAADEVAFAQYNGTAFDRVVRVEMPIQDLTDYSTKEFVSLKNSVAISAINDIENPNFSINDVSAVMDLEYHFGDSRFFINSSNDTAYFSIYALIPGLVEISLLSENTGEILSGSTKNYNLGVGWNLVNLTGEIAISFNEKALVLVKALQEGVLAYKSMNGGTGFQYKDGVIANSGALMQFNMQTLSVSPFLDKPYLKNDRSLVPPSPYFNMNNNFIRPIERMNSGLSYTYTNQDFYISSTDRLKGLNIFCMNAGFVFIDFIRITGNPVVGGVGEYIHDTSKNKFYLKPGWNYIDEADIDIPFFSGLAYVGVRAAAGVLGYNNNGLNVSNHMAIEVNGGILPSTANTAIYVVAFNVVKYQFDIVHEVLSRSIVELPKGQIDVVNTLILNNVKLIGQGVNKTMLFDGRQSGGNLIELSDFSEISDLWVKGSNSGLNKSSNYYNTLTEIQGNIGLESDNGVSIVGLGVRVKNLQITHFGGKAFTSSGQTTRLVHSLISSIQCFNNFIGFDFTSSGEYCNIFGLSASNNILGIKIGGGNTFISSGTFNDNRVGLYMHKTGNDSHGSFSASQFNHSENYSMVIDQISHGHSFVGCHVFEGDIYLYKSIGFNFTGGTIDAMIYAEGGKTQRITNTSFQNAYWDRLLGIQHNFNGVPSFLKMEGNFFMFETGENDSILNN